MKQPLTFFHTSISKPTSTSLSYPERKQSNSLSAINASTKSLQDGVQNTASIDNYNSYEEEEKQVEVSTIDTKATKDKVSNSAAATIGSNRPKTKNQTPQARPAFYARAGAKPPMYAQSANESAVSPATPTTTSAFFGLITVIFLTSFIFVKGTQEAHRRWVEVNRRWEQSRQSRIPVESLNLGIV